MISGLIALIEKAERTNRLDREDIVALLCRGECNEELFAAADRVRRKYLGDEVHLRGLIEFSNLCRCNCLYCGLRRDNRVLERYRLDPATIIGYAEKAAACGYKTVVLQSGEGEMYSLAEMQHIIGSIKALDVAVALSIGEKTLDQLRAYREAGADRYLLRIETTDRRLYGEMHPGMSFENRVRCLRDLRDLEYEVGTGCLIGLPGQTPGSLADDILFFKSLDADMTGVGPFIPNPDTPLGSACGGTLEASMKVMAVTRLLMPDINIPATTAMEVLDTEGRIGALQKGANVVMPSVTHEDYRGLYALYPGKACLSEPSYCCKDRITHSIENIGRRVALGHGFRKRMNNPAKD
jgi:biotin synthase